MLFFAEKSNISILFSLERSIYNFYQAGMSIFDETLEPKVFIAQYMNGIEYFLETLGFKTVDCPLCKDEACLMENGDIEIFIVKQVNIRRKLLQLMKEHKFGDILKILEDDQIIDLFNICLAFIKACGGQYENCRLKDDI